MYCQMAGSCPVGRAVAVANAGGMGGFGALLSPPDAIAAWADAFRAVSARWPRAMSDEHLRSLVPGLDGQEAYVCGPAGMISAAAEALRAAGVPRRQIHVELFEF